MNKPKKELYECMKHNYDVMCKIIESYEKKGEKAPGYFLLFRHLYENAYNILKKEYDNNDEVTVYYITDEEAVTYNKKNEWAEIYSLILRTINYHFGKEKLDYLNKLYFYIMDNKISLPISYYANLYMDGKDISLEEFKELVDNLLRELKKEIKTK